VTDGRRWVNYRSGEKGEGLVEVALPGQPLATRSMATHLPNDYVLGIWVDDHEAWFATSDGLGHGFFPASNKLLTTTASKNSTEKEKP
jgi:hypothetical protein